MIWKAQNKENVKKETPKPKLYSAVQKLLSKMISSQLFSSHFSLPKCDQNQFSPGQCPYTVYQTSDENLKKIINCGKLSWRTTKFSRLDSKESMAIGMES